MKFSLSTFLLSVQAASTLVAAQEEASSCTHGMLFVSSVNSTEVFAMDLNSESLADLPVAMSLDLSADIPVNELNLMATGSNEEVAVIYRGQEDQQYADGAVRFIDAETMSLVENAGFECARAIHFVPHDDKIAIFCDGMVNNVTQTNSTVWVVDETLFGSEDVSAVVYQMTLEGSHHGVAIPVDDNHLLYSLSQPERIAGNFTRAYALPDTFEVSDYEGNVLHSIADTSDRDTSCLGFHGSYAIDNAFALACDDEHGGVLLVDYTEPSYTSRALMYPPEYTAHRTGSFAEHHHAPRIVGNFANGTHAHLMAFTMNETVLTSDHILPLPARQCAYTFEKGDGQYMLVMLPDGQLHVYEVAPTWNLVANATIVDGMQACSEALFTAGVGQAFVMHKDSQMLYTVDLEHASDGELDVYTTSLPFIPFSAVVAGVPEGTECKLSEVDHSEHGHDETVEGVEEDHDHDGDGVQDHAAEEHDDHDDHDGEAGHDDHDDHDHDGRFDGCNFCVGAKPRRGF